MIDVKFNEMERSQVLAALADRELKLKVRIAEHRREPITESRDAAIEQNENALVGTLSAWATIVAAEPWQQEDPGQMTWTSAA